ncbi:hypothetical protein HanIR_Chr06g0298381 [Helianthus annuus]|nr:hypothetical protein HanIR_Chr06g0298381 [Helianthus annuus]
MVVVYFGPLTIEDACLLFDGIELGWSLETNKNNLHLSCRNRTICL